MDDMDELTDIIREEIARDGPLTFARYMALALYHPTLGYYAGGGDGREPLGWSGDYFTSGDVSPLWGWALARQLRQMWELLGCPPRFDVVEVGAGRGLLACEVWRFARFAAPDFRDALRYTVADQAVRAGEAGDGGPREQSAAPLQTAPSLFESRRERLEVELARIGVPEGAVRWVGALDEVSRDCNAEVAEDTERTQREETQRTQRSAAFRKGDQEADQGQRASDLAEITRGAEEESPDSDAPLRPLRPFATPASFPSSASSAVHPPRATTGVIVSNELLDALPVQLVQVVGDTHPALAEVYVTVDASGRLIERLDAPSSPEVAGYLDRFGVPWRRYGAGWRAEVGLAAEAWMREAADYVQRGFMLTIDYGATARQLYTRDRHRGTLAVYAHHQFGDRPLLAPGRQDITAHVNFSALARAGSARGLRVAGYTTQAAFLKALGVREAAEALGTRLYPAADTARPTDRGQADLLRRRLLQSAVATLLDPRGLGGFRVMVQARDVPEARRALLGLRS